MMEETKFFQVYYNIFNIENNISVTLNHVFQTYLFETGKVSIASTKFNVKNKEYVQFNIILDYKHNLQISFQHLMELGDNYTYY